jgi:hypothetical protein
MMDEFFEFDMEGRLSRVSTSFGDMSIDEYFGTGNETSEEE